MNTIEPNAVPLFTIDGEAVSPLILARFILTQSFYEYRPEELYQHEKFEETYETRLERMFLETRRHLEMDYISMGACHKMGDWFANLCELFYAYQYPEAFRSIIADRRQRGQGIGDDTSSVDSTV